MLLIDGDELAKCFVPKQAYFTESIVYKIKTAPLVADPEREKGKWIDDSDLPFDVGCRCSVCGASGCASYWNYCPHCGSDNGGEQNG